MSESTVSVLYIAGLGRSGSTLIGSMLHHVPGFACLGEVHWVWLRGLIENQPCACALPFSECPFWNEILQRAFGGLGRLDGERMHHILQSELRTRHLPAIWGGRRTPRSSEGLRRLGEAVGRIYPAAAAVTGARVLVDISKSPMYGGFLGQVPGLNVRMLHLVRDPRAVAYSFRREKIHPLTGRSMARKPLSHSAGLWAVWNLVLANTGRKSAHSGTLLRIRYEDFVRQPREVFQRIVAFAGGDFTGPPFRGPTQIELGPNHILVGNFVRYQRGLVEIEPDMHWKAAMTTAEKALVTSLTWPLLPFYGYPLVA